MFRRLVQQIFSPAKTTVYSYLPARTNYITFRNHWSCLKNTGLNNNIQCKANQMNGALISKTNSISSLQNRPLLVACSPLVDSIRTKISVSLRRGFPKTVKSVVKRFKRLDWGIWIRPRAGRRKYLWKKSESRKYRLRQHVFCNKQQSKLLDKMVTSYWKKTKYFVDDPYEPYQKRTNMSHRFPEKPPFLP